MATRRFIVDQTYKPTFTGSRAKSVVEEGGALEAVVSECLTDGRKVKKVIYKLMEDGQVKKISLV